MENDSWRGEREEVAKLSDDELLKRLAGWQPGTEPYLIVQREIDRRKEASRDALEDSRFRKTEFRSWVAVGLSAIALAVALGTALYK
jgi:hypothetical protein